MAAHSASGELRPAPGGWAPAAGVAAVEAVSVAGYGVLLLLSGARGDGLLLALALTGVAFGTAVLLLSMARAFLAGRRWPTGGFLTVQLFVLVLAVSLGGPSLLMAADHPRAAILTAVALLVAVAGLVAVARGPARPPSSGRPTERASD